MGQPKKVYSFRLSDELVEKIRYYGQKDNRSLTNQVETLLYKFVNEQERKLRQDV